MEELDEKLHIRILDFDQEKRARWVAERKPYSALFELTARCNFSCVHCYLSRRHNSEELTTAEVKHIIDILREKGILFLTFTGGEVMTRTDFLEIYLYAKKLGFLVEVFTNGSLFTDEIISTMVKYPPLLVDISIYGSSSTTYRQLTGTDSFERVIGNCRKLKEAGVRFSLKSPILTLTLNEVDGMKRIADELGVKFVHTYEILPTVDKGKEPLDYSVPLSTALRNEFENYYKQVENGTRVAGTHTNDESNMAALAQCDRVYSCNVAQNSFVIDYKGHLCPCMRLRHKGIDLLSNDFDHIWNGFSRFGEQLASAGYACMGCEARYYCDVCPGEMDLLYGDSEFRPSSICQPAKIRKLFYQGEIGIEEALELASKY